ncbi:MAG: hypothetical protein O7A64_08610 [Alphaproteobacteria bacterium]|nr:hypothetical protein [Alphaproteobacteria bacterium]
MQDNEAIPHEPHEGSGGSTLSLFLGLYLLVLSFFILLVTISTREELKSQAVMDSLTSTFRSILPPSTDLTAFSAKEGTVLVGQRFQEQITKIFTMSMRVIKVEIVQPGRLMRLVLPADALFFTGDTEIRPARFPLLDRLVATLSGRPPGLRFDMEFIVGSAYTPDNDLPLRQTLEMARAGAFARAMLARGVPPDSISVGLKPGSREDVVIWFYVRDPEKTRLRFGAANAPPVRDGERGEPPVRGGARTEPALGGGRPDGS